MTFLCEGKLEKMSMVQNNSSSCQQRPHEMSFLLLNAPRNSIHVTDNNASRHNTYTIIYRMGSYRGGCSTAQEESIRYELSGMLSLQSVRVDDQKL
jgi:hypothetical protein